VFFGRRRTDQPFLYSEIVDAEDVGAAERKRLTEPFRLSSADATNRDEAFERRVLSFFVGEVFFFRLRRVWGDDAFRLYFFGEVFHVEDFLRRRVLLLRRCWGRMIFTDLLFLPGDS